MASKSPTGGGIGSNQYGLRGRSKREPRPTRERVTRFARTVSGKLYRPRMDHWRLLESAGVDRSRLVFISDKQGGLPYALRFGSALSVAQQHRVAKAVIAEASGPRGWHPDDEPLICAAVERLDSQRCIFDGDKTPLDPEDARRFLTAAGVPAERLDQPGLRPGVGRWLDDTPPERTLLEEFRIGQTSLEDALRDVYGEDSHEERRGYGFDPEPGTARTERVRELLDAARATFAARLQ